MAKTISVSMNRERDTKNTVRFAEEGEREDQQLGTIYLPKRTLADLGNPKSVTVTIEAA